MNLITILRLLPLFSWLFLAESPMYSQEIKLLEGQVISDSIPTANIHIVNLDLEKGTSSDDTGKFKIYVRISDTLLFSSVQFENRKVIISAADLEDDEMVVKLYPARNELQEIQVTDLKLSGHLDKDLPKVKIFDRQKYGIPYPEKKLTQTERKLYTANANITSRWQYIGVLLGGVPLDVIMNDINGRTKYLKALDKQDKLQIRVQRGISLLGRTFFISELDIPENEVENFVYYCAEDSEYDKLLDSPDMLKLIEYYKSKRQDFIDLRQITQRIEN